MSSTKQPSSRSPRLDWIDIAKAYGVFWVFLAHIAQEFYLAEGSEAVLAGLKFPASFLIGMYLILSGYTYKPRNYDFRSRVRYLFQSRIYPVWMFNVLWIVLWLVAAGILVARGLPAFEGARPFAFAGLGIVSMVVLGLPILNVPVWFLVCLFTTEVIYLRLQNWVADNRRLIMVCVGTFVLGGIINSFRVWFNVWYVQEAVVALAFYMLGIGLKRGKVLERFDDRKLLWAGLAIILLGLTWVTFDLNQGSFFESRNENLDTPPVVYQAAASHGNYVWFTVTALTGAFGMIALAKITPPMRWLTYMGRNILLLIGINGLNRPMFRILGIPDVDGIAELLPAGSLTEMDVWIWPLLILFTLIAVAISLPLIPLLNRIPHLMGRPRQRAKLISQTQ